jgi:hypothetical protein
MKPGKFCKPVEINGLKKQYFFKLYCLEINKAHKSLIYGLYTDVGIATGRE